MRDILGAAPDPVFVLSEEGTVLAANPATQRAFGDDQILGQPLEGFVSTRHAREALIAAALSESEAEVELTLGAGAVWRMLLRCRRAGARSSPRGARRAGGGRVRARRCRHEILRLRHHRPRRPHPARCSSTTRPSRASSKGCPRAPR